MIKIWRKEGLYAAEATVRNRDHRWKSEGFFKSEELIKQLLHFGCHQTDIADVLNELDKKPNGDQCAQV